MSVGKSLPHDAARLHVTGAARYVDDIPTPANCLHLAFGLSDTARGVITRADLSKVRQAPGVIAVMTAIDLPHANDVSPSAHDEPLLATGEVFYRRPTESSSLIATSHSRRTQSRAIGARLTIDPLGPPSSRLRTLWKLTAGLKKVRVIWSRGDASESDEIRQTSHVVEGTIDMGGQEHFYLEGQAALALPQEGG